jgi:uncharacterized protein YoxC
MSDWEVSEWLAFFGGIATLIAAIATAAVQVIKELRKVETAVCETQQTVKEHDVASAVRHSQTQHTLKGETDA